MKWRLLTSLSVLLLLSLILSLVAGCNGETDTPAGTATPASRSTSTPSSTRMSTPTANPVETPPPGTPAVFVTLKMNSRTESWPSVGGRISWDTTDYGLLRYFPDFDILDIFSSTSSYSYSGSHLYPFTVNGRIFSVNTRSGKTITEYDPLTGKAIGTSCRISTYDDYRGFAIVGDQIFYVDNYGDLAVRDLPCSGPARTLIEKGGHTVSSRYMYGISNQLVSVGLKTPGQYAIRIHNKSTGAVERTLLTLDEDDVYGLSFFAGDDALYWPVFNENTLQLRIMRYPLSGTPQQIISLTLSTALNAGMTVDESGGKVLLVYMDGYPASGGDVHFYLYDLDSHVLNEWDIDSSFYSQLIFSTQLLVLE